MRNPKGLLKPVPENGMQEVVNAFTDQEDADTDGYGDAFRACREYLEDHGQLELPDSECKTCGMVLDHGLYICSDCHVDVGGA